MEYKKSIHFDLHTKELKNFFKDTREPYGLIKQFMLENGFEWKQYSGYTSLEPMSYIKIINIVDSLSHKFPWLNQCIRELDITSVVEEQSAKFVFDNNYNAAEINKYKIKKEETVNRQQKNTDLKKNRNMFEK